MTTGVFEFLDATQKTARFYRVKWVQ